MKATINNITVEGTPQEIMEYQRLQQKRTDEELTKHIHNWCRDQSVLQTPHITSVYQAKQRQWQDHWQLNTNPMDNWAYCSSKGT